MRASVVRLPAKTAPKTGERLRPLNIPGTEALTVKQAQGVQRLSIVRGHVATLGEAMALEGDHCALNCPQAGRPRTSGRATVFPKVGYTSKLVKSCDDPLHPI